MNGCLSSDRHCSAVRRHSSMLRCNSRQYIQPSASFGWGLVGRRNDRRREQLGLRQHSRLLGGRDFAGYGRRHHMGGWHLDHSSQRHNSSYLYMDSHLHLSSQLIMREPGYNRFTDWPVHLAVHDRRQNDVCDWLGADTERRRQSLHRICGLVESSKRFIRYHLKPRH